jgi:hypothetical protein
MKYMLLVVALTLLLTGCASSGTQVGNATTTVGLSTTTPTTVPFAAGVTTTVNTGYSPVDDPSISRADAAGNTPEAIVLKLVATVNRKDWSSVYAQYAEPNVDYAEMEQEWTVADTAFVNFVVHETRVEREDLAFVRVTYVVSQKKLDGTPDTFEIGEPGQWWALVKVDGCWKTRWMPAQ